MTDQNKTPDGVTSAGLAGDAGSALLYTPPTQAEIVAAINEWMTERTVRDPGEQELAKIWLRLNREKIKVCPECDGKCGEDCAITAEQHWAALHRPKPARPPGECPWPTRPTAYGG